MSLGPWRWLANCPEPRRLQALQLWSTVLQALVKAAPSRDDPRLHVTDLLTGGQDERTPEVARLLADGISKHAKWREILRSAGIVTAEEPELTDGVLVGTPDYLVELGDEIVLDVKSVGSGNFQRVREGTPLPHHRKQVAAYLELRPKAAFGVLLYEDRDTLDLALCIVERDPEAVARLRERRRGPEGSA